MFNRYLPTLDLHGEITEMADLLVKEFILENYMLGNKKVVIIHGMGSGKLKNAIHESLSKNKLVSEYKLDMFNLGCTIIEININVSINN